MPARRSAAHQADQAMAAAARQFMAVQAGYAGKGMALSQAALCGARDFVEWAHYPANDCTDADSGFEFYYHAHTRDEMSADEHGHFHVFRRDPRRADKFFHVIGVSLDARGLPIKLFTTNTWVTGETMAPATQVAKAAQQFGVKAHGRAAPIARWLTALMQLYATEIAELARERDEKLERLASASQSRKVLQQDRRVRVLSQRRVNMLKKLNQHCPTLKEVAP